MYNRNVCYVGLVQATVQVLYASERALAHKQLGQIELPEKPFANCQKPAKDHDLKKFASRAVLRRRFSDSRCYEDF